MDNSLPQQYNQTPPPLPPQPTGESLPAYPPPPMQPQPSSIQQPQPLPEDNSSPELTLQNRLIIQKTELEMKMESLILQTKPYLLYRWLFYSFFCALLLGRMLFQKRFYAIVYICFIVHISLLIQFVSPKFDPEIYGPEYLPNAYEPFKRKLPEFQFWTKITKAVLLSNFATLFPFLDLPVYAPLLFGYLFVIFIISFQERITHMIRNHYVPFSFGKPKHKKDNE